VSLRSSIKKGKNLPKLVENDQRTKLYGVQHNEESMAEVNPTERTQTGREQRTGVESKGGESGKSTKPVETVDLTQE